MKRAVISAALLALVATGAGAGEWSGEAAVEFRYFTQEPRDPVQHEELVSVYAQPEYFHDWVGPNGGNIRFVATPYLRIDSGDPERTHGDLRELYWQRSFDAAELSVGVRKVFWGVTESIHLVDIINQVDLVDNLDAEDRLGQPMVNLRLLPAWGTIDLFVMPFFRERTFPGEKGRLRAPIVVDTDNPRYESSAEQTHTDLAVRWSHFIGDWDIGIAHFEGTGREPTLLPEFNDDGELVLIPFYPQIGQTSIDLQVTKGSWLWKLEGFFRTGQGDDFIAAAGGFEYTLYGLFGSPADLGVIAEYLYDERGNIGSPFQRDVALGLRMTLNDVQSTEVLAFSGVDVTTRSSFTSIEASRRIGQSWRLSLEARIFSNAEPDEQLFSLLDDDYIELALAKFF